MTEKKKIEELFSGPGVPNEKYRPVVKHPPDHDYLSILKAVAKGQYRVIPYENHIWVLTLRAAIKRLEKEGKIAKGEYHSRSRKRPDHKEDTIVWHE